MEFTINSEPGDPEKKSIIIEHFEKRFEKLSGSFGLTLGISFFYAILVLLSYINLHMYYSYFDIPIYSYITITEVIIPFLPTIITVLMASAIVLGLYIILTIIGINDKKINDYKPYYTISSINNSIKSRRWNWKEILSKIKRSLLQDDMNQTVTENRKQSIKRFLALYWDIYKISFKFIFTILMIIQILLVARFIIIFIYKLFNDVSFITEFYSGGIIIIFISLSILWIFIDKPITNLIMLITGQQGSTYINNVIYFIMLILSINLYSLYSNALRIAQGKPEYTIHFDYQNNHIESDTCKVYIGKTADYIFIKDLVSKNNYVYLVKDMHNIVFRKYEYKKLSILYQIFQLIIVKEFWPFDKVNWDELLKQNKTPT
jgi:hypothetical protein